MGVETASFAPMNFRGLNQGRAIALLRCALGVIFLWFGVLKLFPGHSPAEALAGKTILVITLGLVKPVLSVPLLGLFEAALGLLLISGQSVRLTITLMLFHMAGTLTPLVLFPHDTFAAFPFQPNLVGQYILKNFVLIAAALVVAGAESSGVREPLKSEEPLSLAA